MRIAFISYEFPPETLGGIATYTRHTVEMLLDLGHEVIVFAGTHAATPRVERWRGASVFRLPCEDRTRFGDRAVPALVAEHVRNRFDVAETPDLYAEGRGLRAQAADLPFVLRAHTPLYIASEIDFKALAPAGRVLSALRRFLGATRKRLGLQRALREAWARLDFRTYFDFGGDLERQVALQADLVAPPSQRLAARLRADWHVSEERLRVLPYPHSPAKELLTLPPPESVHTIGFHGGLRYFKGVHVLVAAMQRVAARHPGVRLALAGTSGTSPVPNYSRSAWLADRMIEWQDTLAWLRPQLAALGENVIIRGFVRPENLVSHLAEVDLCVFPSLFDNFPSACLEAMSAARAIVATRSGGMEEMLDGGEAGLLVSPGKVRQLADAICRLIEDPVLRLRFALRARARLIREYSPAAIGPRYETLYREAVALRHAAVGTIRS